MMEHNYQLFLALLRTAMTGEPFEPVPSAQEWSELFKIAGQQSVMGVCYTAFSHLSKDQMPPMELLVKWMAEAETIRHPERTGQCTAISRQTVETSRRYRHLGGRWKEGRCSTAHGIGTGD